MWQQASGNQTVFKLQLMPYPKIGKYTFPYYFNHDLKAIRHNANGETLHLEFDNSVDHVCGQRQAFCNRYKGLLGNASKNRGKALLSR